VETKARAETARNHTVTHILHSVLRQDLGDHVKQAGSLVAPDRLRFDFTHYTQVDIETLDTIERQVNQRIRENVVVGTQTMAAEDAFESGAMALFEEKYEDQVRVVSLSDFSKELCGGTHVGRTGDIGLFRITGETSVSAGIRRIEAVTGEAALSFTQTTFHLLQETAHLVKEQLEAVPQRIRTLISSHKSFEKEVASLKAKLAKVSTEQTDDAIKQVNGIRVLSKKVSADSPGALRDLADTFKERISSGVVVLGSISGRKALLTAIVTKDLTNRFHAGNLVKEIAAIVGGGGGGRADMAQAGGTKPEKLDQALEKVYELVEKSHE
jgi:alanyl-tRNA synthetase